MPSIRTILSGIVIATALLPLHAVMAAPFCLEVRGGTPLCYYYDASECQKHALEMSGLCVANRDEVAVSIGNSYYCLVDSSRSALCVYSDRNSCVKDAARMGGACVDSRSVDHPLDPYIHDPGRNY